MADRPALVPVSVTRSHAVEGPLIPQRPHRTSPASSARPAPICVTHIFACARSSPVGLGLKCKRVGEKPLGAIARMLEQSFNRYLVHVV